MNPFPSAALLLLGTAVTGKGTGSVSLGSWAQVCVSAGGGRGGGVALPIAASSLSDPGHSALS